MDEATSSVKPIKNYVGAAAALAVRRAIKKASAKPVTYIQMAYRPGMIAMSLLFNKVMATVMEMVEFCKPVSIAMVSACM